MTEEDDNLPWWEHAINAFDHALRARKQADARREAERDARRKKTSRAGDSGPAMDPLPSHNGHSAGPAFGADPSCCVAKRPGRRIKRF